MKKHVLFLIIFSSIEYSPAQTLSPELTSTSGNTFTNGISQLDWTLGEPLVASLNDGNNLLTQGLHQNNLIITTVENSDADYSLTIFPNPTSDIVQLQSSTSRDENIVMALYNAAGELLLTRYSNLNIVPQINLSKYSCGSYLLKIEDRTTKGKSYQIIKLK